MFMFFIFELFFFSVPININVGDKNEERKPKLWYPGESLWTYLEFVWTQECRVGVIIFVANGEVNTHSWPWATQAYTGQEDNGASYLFFKDFSNRAQKHSFLHQQMNRYTKRGTPTQWNTIWLTKEGHSDTCYSMDGPWGHYARWNKPVTKRHTRYESISVRSLESSNS